MFLFVLGYLLNKAKIYHQNKYILFIFYSKNIVVNLLGDIKFGFCILIFK